jgi:hypothetical protein
MGQYVGFLVPMVQPHGATLRYTIYFCYLVVIGFRSIQYIPTFSSLGNSQARIVIGNDQLPEIFDLYLTAAVAMTTTLAEVEPHNVFDTILTLDFG